MVKSHRHDFLQLQEKHLYIDDSSALPPTEVRARARRIAETTWWKNWLHHGRLLAINQSPRHGR